MSMLNITNTDPKQSTFLVSETVMSPPTPKKKSTQIGVRKRKSQSRYLVKGTTMGVIERKIRKFETTILKPSKEIPVHLVTTMKIKHALAHKRKIKKACGSDAEFPGLNVEPLDSFIDPKVM